MALTPDLAGSLELTALDAAACIERSLQALALGDHHGGLAAAEAAGAAAQELRHKAQAASLSSLHAWRLGDLVRAYRSGHDAAEAWDGIDAVEGSKALCTLSLVCADLGAYGESVITASQAFERAEAAGSLPRMAIALNAVGSARHRIGDHEQGRSCLLRALACAEEQRDPDAILAALNNLSASSLVAYHDQVAAGQTDAAAASAAEAATYAQRAVSLAEASGDPYRLAAVLCNLGEALGVKGDGEAALAALARAEAIAGEQRNARLALHVRVVIGQQLVRGGHLPQAIDHLRDTLEGLHGNEHNADRTQVHAALHRALADQGDFEQALRHCEAVLAGERRRVVERTRSLAALAVSRSDLQTVRLENERERERSARLERQAREFEFSALRDPLTGLGNRRWLDRALQSLGGRSAACLVVLDIDHFKRINDRFGHAVGDAVLRELAALLGRSLRDSDTAVRLGGEEFCLVLMPADAAAALVIAERLREAIEATDWWRLAKGLAVTASLGVTAWTGDAAESIERADAAMYGAKHGGRNRVCVAAPAVRAHTP